MLSAVQAYFENPSAWLVLLKYLGLFLAAGSSIWGTINVLTVATADGRKRLTSAGVAAIAFTITGLIISVVSEDLQRRRAAAAQSAQLKAEAKRTNAIIMAGQPLTSLGVEWEVRGLDAPLLQMLKKSGDETVKSIMSKQGERASDQNSILYRQNQLYPFLSQLARRFVKPAEGEQTNANVLVLIALDDDYNAVLPFGSLRTDEIWLSGGAKPKKGSPPESVEIGQKSDTAISKILQWPNLRWNQEKKSAVIGWRLDPSSFANSINRQNTFILPTAKPPTVLRVAVLFNVAALPFAPGNLALPTDQNFWNYPNYPDSMNEAFRGRVDLITKDFSSSVRLVPNSSSLAIYDYKLNQVYETLFLDDFSEAIPRLRCLVFEFQRVDD